MRHRIKKFESCWHFRDKENPKISSSRYKKGFSSEEKLKIITTSKVINGAKMMSTYFVLLFQAIILQTIILGVSSSADVSGKTNVSFLKPAMEKTSLKF